jgi:hypothetical protein
MCCNICHEDVKKECSDDGDPVIIRRCMHISVIHSINMKQYDKTLCFWRRVPCCYLPIEKVSSNRKKNISRFGKNFTKRIS